MRKFLLGALTLLLLQSCEKGFVVIEKSENFPKEKAKVKEKGIYYLDPTITSYFIRDEVDNQFLITEKYKAEVAKEMSGAGRKCGFKIVLINDKELKNTYSKNAEELLQLRRSINNITALQENPLNSGRRRSDKGFIQQKVFVATPKFPAEFSHLSESFSPYFGIAGIFAVDAQPSNSNTRKFVRKHESLQVGKYYYFYHIVVNIETSEVIYREVKKVPYRFTNKYLSPVVYDSYALLKKNLK